jgi:hypothetical protein
MWLCAAALAGDLVVSSVPPVHVYVGGQHFPPAPGSREVHLSQLDGVYHVQLAGLDNMVVAETQVHVPWDGLRTLHFDGVSLVIGTPPAAPARIVYAPPPPPAPAAPAAPTAMEPGSFAALLQVVNGRSYGDDKVAAIRTAAAGNWFTIAQVARLIDTLSYGADKVAAVQACAPRVVDPENAFSLASHFSYGSDADQAMAAFR